MLIKVFSLFLFLPDYLLLDRVAIQGYPWYKHLEYSQPLPLPELVHIEDMKTPVKSIDYIKRANQYQKYICECMTCVFVSINVCLWMFIHT